MLIVACFFAFTLLAQQPCENQNFSQKVSEQSFFSILQEKNIKLAENLYRTKEERRPEHLLFES